MNAESISFEKQLDLFSERGMKVNRENKEKNIGKLKTIGYYRLKEFAKPYSDITQSETGEISIKYNNISFDNIVGRYYQDKNLRMFLLHAIEKIEVSIKTNLAYILGKKYGAFGYLNFSHWASKKKYSKFEILEKEYQFKKQLKKSIKKTSIDDVNYDKNKEADGFPSVWITMNVLMFGEMVNIIDLLPSKSLRELASKYDCKGEEFISWIKTLNLVRNICAHNSNIIDFKLKTKPIYRKKWSNYLCTIQSNDNDILTDKFAVILIIIMHFIFRINSKYYWSNINKSLLKITNKSEQNARRIGFKNCESLNQFIKVSDPS